MKILIGALLSIALVITGYYLMKTLKKDHRLASGVSKILWVGFAMVFFYIFAMLIEVERIALVAYSAYYISVGWLVFFLLYFSLEYSGTILEEYVRKDFMMILLVLDSLALVWNIFSQELFTLNWTPVFRNESIYKPQLTELFYVHYTFLLMCAVLCLIGLVHRFFTSPAFYRGKYLAIALIFVAMVALNVHGFWSPLDFSIVGYVAEVICIYYCSFVYTPQRLLPKTLTLVTDNMTVGVLALDLEGKVIYSNKVSEQFLNEEDPLRDSRNMDLVEWCREQSVKYSKEAEIEEVFYRGTEAFAFKIQLQRIVDNKKQLQGCYFTIQDRTEEIMELRKKQHLATHDRLTDLYIKEFFYEQSEIYIKTHPTEDLLIICTDFKEFKMVNDFFGSKVGDKVLQNYADKIRKVEKKLIAYGRLGNDNFAVLMKKEAFKEADFDITTREAFAGTEHRDVAFQIIPYVGVYEVTERDLMVSVMCGRARMALNTIKGDRTRKVAYYDKVLRENIVEEQQLSKDLEKALEKKQLEMYLQPQATVDGRVIGAEALVRWNHPQKKLLGPEKFVPIFEKNGLITEVDKFIWESACKQLQIWKQEGKDELYISVNVSPKDFYFVDVYQTFMELLRKYEISPKNLKLEITESAVMMDFERQQGLIQKLRDAGFVVEMDDFGSAYSSLNMLKDIYVDVLKLDMAFLKQSEDNERGRTIMKMVIGLSKNLGIPVISEGVETSEQLEFLAEMGCDMFQGYFLGRPMDVKQFEEFYVSRQTGV